MKPAGGFPPCDVVERMVLCYHAPHLAYEHLRETTGLLACIVPELECRSVLESTVQIYLGLKRSAPFAERLLELAQDGEINQDQRAEFEEIVTALRELVRPCLELNVYWRGGGRREEQKS